MPESVDLVDQAKHRGRFVDQLRDVADLVVVAGEKRPQFRRSCG
jgi:hypothetical protein